MCTKEWPQETPQPTAFPNSSQAGESRNCSVFFSEGGLNTFFTNLALALVGFAVVPTPSARGWNCKNSQLFYCIPKKVAMQTSLESIAHHHLTFTPYFQPFKPKVTPPQHPKAIRQQHRNIMNSSHPVAPMNAIISTSSPTQHDVLSGRGGYVNAHPGNVSYREIVQARRREYSLEASKERKMEICREVIAAIYNRGGHFLAKDESSTGTILWKTMVDEKVVAKTTQALREGAPKIREACSKDKSSRPSKKRLRGSSEVAPNSSPVKKQNSGSSTKAAKTIFVPIEHSPQHTSSSSSLQPDSYLFISEQASTGSVHLFEKEENATRLGDEVRPQDAPFMIPDLVDFEVPPQSNKRRHSLILSDISPHPNYLEEEFVDPFLDETWFTEEDEIMFETMVMERGPQE